jgi:hypothetical protein
MFRCRTAGSTESAETSFAATSLCSSFGIRIAVCKSSFGRNSRATINLRSVMKSASTRLGLGCAIFKSGIKDLSMQGPCEWCAYFGLPGDQDSVDLAFGKGLEDVLSAGERTSSKADPLCSHHEEVCHTFTLREITCYAATESSRETSSPSALATGVSSGQPFRST